MENTGIPISSEARLTPAHAPGHGFWYSLRRQGQGVVVDGPPGAEAPEGAAVLFTSRRNPTLPEGVEEIPFPAGRAYYFLLRAGDLLFAGAAATACPHRDAWRTLASSLPPETLVLSCDLPPMTLSALLDRLPAPA